MTETNAERLRKVKEAFQNTFISFGRKNGKTQFVDDLNWLFEQAEQVASLEREKETFRRMITENLKPANVLLEKENKRLREAIIQSLEKHKWNNEESARILEQALEGLK